MKCSTAEFSELTKDILNRKAGLRFQARGRSMYPAIRDGDILNVEPIAINEIRLGDVLFYKSEDGSTAVHRLIKRFFREGRILLVIKGDANKDHGEEVSPEMVVGIIKIVERRGRKIHLEHISVRLQSIFYGVFSPVIISFKRIGSKFLPHIQGIKVYRNLAKKLIHSEIVYQWQAAEGSARSLLAKSEDKVVGVVTIKNILEFNFYHQGWWIFDMWVDWHYRRLGIGRQLTDMTCTLAAKKGASKVNLLVFTDNKPAINFYQKMGFYQTSIPKIDEELKDETKLTQRKQIIMERDV